VPIQTRYPEDNVLFEIADIIEEGTGYENASVDVVHARFCDMVVSLSPDSTFLLLATLPYPPTGSELCPPRPGSRSNPHAGWNIFLRRVHKRRLLPPFHQCRPQHPRTTSLSLLLYHDRCPQSSLQYPPNHRDYYPPTASIIWFIPQHQRTDSCSAIGRLDE
jgi:hypothetical protein